MNKQTKDKVQEIKDDLQLMSFEIAHNKLNNSPKEDRKLFESSLNNLVEHVNYYENKKKAETKVKRVKSILKNSL